MYLSGQHKRMLHREFPLFVLTVHPPYSRVLNELDDPEVHVLLVSTIEHRARELCA